MQQEVDISKISILIYFRSCHRGNHLICLLSLHLRNNFLLLFLFHSAMASGSPLYSSPNWQSYRTVNHLQKLSEARRKKGGSTGIQPIGGYLINTDYSVPFNKHELCQVLWMSIIIRIFFMLQGHNIQLQRTELST